MFNLNNRKAICEIDNDNGTGTGFLVSSDIVLTALHCVDSLGDSELILKFCEGPKIRASVVYENAEKDICLLKLEEGIQAIPIKLQECNLAENVNWSAFGYPASKSSVGHQLSGTVSRVLTELIEGIDLDLQVSQDNSLDRYEGFSGAPLMIQGHCVGIIRLQIDRSIGALSIQNVAQDLAECGVEIHTEHNRASIDSDYLTREGFQAELESLIEGGQYHFLEGVHGIGKTTFCKKYIPASESVHILGTYALLDSEELSGPDFRVRTSIFMDWATSIRSILQGERTSKYDVTKESSLAEDFNCVLSAYNDYCSNHNKLGLLFIDGLNEPKSTDKLSKLLSIFPQSLPSNISIIFTATNFSNLNINFPCTKNTKNSHCLPALSDYKCEVYCRLKLEGKSNFEELTSSIIAKVCGHPLYLRYLVEEVSTVDSDFDFSSIPTFQGDIEEYYEKIWSNFDQDTNAVSLLAVICRLRERLQKNYFMQLLSAAQKAVAISTFIKIQHLLESREEVGMYHNSFGQFIEDKTNDISAEIHTQIANACASGLDIDYASKNLIYHHLKGTRELQLKGVELCCQEWADKSVKIGVEPDILNHDIESVISKSSSLGMANETVRLLLLAQRIKFRNNSLFLKNAFLVAQSLISIGKHHDALAYIIRYDTLVISSLEALELSYTLILREEFDCAYDILDKVLTEGHRALSRNEHSISELINICHLLAWTYVYLQDFDDDDDYLSKFNILSRILKIGAEHCSDNISDAEIRDILVEITHIPYTFSIINQRYRAIDGFMEMTDIDSSPEKYNKVLKEFIKTILYSCVKATEQIKLSSLKKPKETFRNMFKDIDKYPIDSSLVVKSDPSYFLSALIESGAPSSLVESLYIDYEQQRLSALTEPNGVDVNFSHLVTFFNDNQIVSFRELNTEIASINSIEPHEWEVSLIELVLNIALIDGKIRRLHSEEELLSEEIKESLENLDALLEPLIELKLLERVSWENSYAIPESLIPWLLEKCFGLYCEFYPEEIPRVLSIFTDAVDLQFGIYCEGGRRAIHDIISTLFHIELPPEIVVNVVQFIDKCQIYAIERIENRQDLIPFLLEITHWYGNFGAIEKAEQTYSLTLNYSMGPNWYKEDQFSILLESFKGLDTPSSCQYLPVVEDLLNKVDGELTFRRYVRYEKESLFGCLVNNGMVKEAFAYFKKQTCGSIDELVDELEREKSDRISKYVGNRYPGNQIDERGAILQLNENSNIDWRLHFALLKIYAAGDDRHLDDIAKKYANLINRHITLDNSEEMCKKVLLHDQSGIAQSQRSNFRGVFYSNLDDNGKSFTANYFSDWDKKKSTSEVVAPSVKEPDTKENSVKSLDDFYTPGLFGTTTSDKQSLDKTTEAESQAALGNTVAAKEAAINSLLLRQAGGWSIWHNRSSLRSNWNYIKDGCSDSSALIQVMNTLITSEQYAWEWKIAEKLIHILNSKQNDSEKLELMEYVADHVSRIIATQPIAIQIATEESICNFSDDDNTFDFIVWLADHPKRVRRDLAAEALADILNRDSKYWALASQIAFSDRTGYAPDVICGILKHLAQKDSKSLWTKIRVSLNKVDLKSFTHCSRFSILHQIAELANDQQFVNYLDSRMVKNATSVHTQHSELLPSEYLTPIAEEVNFLVKAAVCGKEINGLVMDCLAEYYTPMALEDIKEIEDLVLLSFREPDNGRLSRFDTSLVWALNCCLFKYMNKENHVLIENTLRLYNPNLPSLGESVIEQPDGILYLEGLFERNIDKLVRPLLQNGMFVISHKEMVTIESDTKFLEITALIIDRNINHFPLVPPLKAKFSAIEYPKLEFNTPRVYETCSSVIPMLVPLGEFTPAVPLPEFLQLTGSMKGDFQSEYWHLGASQSIYSLGIFDSKGSRLTIEQEKLKIPENRKLVWAIYSDRDLMVIVDEMKSFLYM